MNIPLHHNSINHNPCIFVVSTCNKTTTFHNKWLGIPTYIDKKQTPQIWFKEETKTKQSPRTHSTIFHQSQTFLAQNLTSKLPFVKVISLSLATKSNNITMTKGNHNNTLICHKNCFQNPLSLSSSPWNDPYEQILLLHYFYENTCIPKNLCLKKELGFHTKTLFQK